MGQSKPVVVKAITGIGCISIETVKWTFMFNAFVIGVPRGIELPYAAPDTKIQYEQLALSAGTRRFAPLLGCSLKAGKGLQQCRVWMCVSSGKI
jgi:hypothetical protein